MWANIPYMDPKGYCTIAWFSLIPEVQLEGAHFINDGRLTCKFGDLTVPVQTPKWLNTQVSKVGSGGRSCENYVENVL